MKFVKEVVSNTYYYYQQYAVKIAIIASKVAKSSYSRLVYEFLHVA